MSIFDSNWFRNFTFITIFFLVIFLSRFHPVLVDKEYLRIQDFAYYLELTKYWWHSPGNIYQLDYQIQLYSQLFGTVIDRPMPVMWSPAILLVFSPLALLSFASIETAHIFWVSLSIFVALFSLSIIKGKFTPIISVLFLTPIALNTAIFGQISILACAIYCLLVNGFAKTKIGWHVIGLIILAIKPTFLAPAFVILLARKQYHVLLSFGLLLIGWFLLVEVRSGFGVINTYVNVLSMFSQEVIKAPYNLSFDPNINVNSLMFLKPYIGWDTSYLISVTLFILFQLTAVFIAVFSGDTIRAPQSFFLSMSGYLLFSPYLGWYEELLLMPLVLYVVFNPQNEKHTYVNILIFTIFITILFRQIEVTPMQLSVYFVLRVILLILLANSFKPSRQVVVGCHSGY